MGVYLDEHGFKKTWDHMMTDHYEGYLPRMTDYHMHDYFEISLIVSGNVSVLLPDLSESSTHPKLVLMRPRTPHFIISEPNMLYKRYNVLFSWEFVADYVPEWKRFSMIFGRNGAIRRISGEESEEYVALVKHMEEETDLFRKRLYLFLFLSLIAERMEPSEELPEPPVYVTGVLSYIAEHYAERILVSELAWRFGIGRTTLMTAFKRYTGTTVNEYILRCRLKHAIRCLRSGMTEERTAELCGFGDACNLIRTFKRYFGMTPRRYVLENV